MSHSGDQMILQSIISGFHHCYSQRSDWQGEAYPICRYSTGLHCHSAASQICLWRWPTCLRWRVYFTCWSLTRELESYSSSECKTSKQYFKCVKPNVSGFDCIYELYLEKNKWVVLECVYQFWAVAGQVVIPEAVTEKQINFSQFTQWHWERERTATKEHVNRRSIQYMQHNKTCCKY